jgi:nucleoside-diphosphate kinase
MWSIIQRYESLWLRMVACSVQNLTEAQLQDHYAHLADKPFFPKIVAYMTSAPVMIQLWEWDNAVATVRKVNGATNPAEAQPWTVRGDFALTIDHNIVHASENLDDARAETERFFHGVIPAHY